MTVTKLEDGLFEVETVDGKWAFVHYAPPGETWQGDDLTDSEQSEAREMIEYGLIGIDCTAPKGNRRID